MQWICQISKWSKKLASNKYSSTFWQQKVRVVAIFIPQKSTITGSFQCKYQPQPLNSSKTSRGTVLTPLLFVLYIEGLNKMSAMSGKHRVCPTREDKTIKLHSNVGRHHQANFNNIAQAMTATYADDVSILSTVSSMFHSQKALSNVVIAEDN